MNLFSSLKSKIQSFYNSTQGQHVYEQKSDSQETEKERIHAMFHEHCCLRFGDDYLQTGLPGLSLEKDAYGEFNDQRLRLLNVWMCVKLRKNCSHLSMKEFKQKEQRFMAYLWEFIVNNLHNGSRTNLHNGAKQNSDIKTFADTKMDIESKVKDETKINIKNTNNDEETKSTSATNNNLNNPHCILPQTTEIEKVKQIEQVK